MPRALDESERLLSGGVTDIAELESRIRDFIGREPLATAEIVAVCHPDTLEPITAATGPVLVVLFVRIGRTRLLDNRVIGTPRDSTKDMEAA
ncbi:Pantothenate synthetase [compost metagenome]